MAIDYDSIKNAVRNLGLVADNEAFLEQFLAAFDFPKTTLARSKAASKDSGVYIRGNGGIFFLPSTEASLRAQFLQLKKNDLTKKETAFILIVNDTDLLAWENVSGDILETSKKELYKHIEFFFPLLGIKTDALAADMKSVSLKAAEKFAQLYNELSLENPSHRDDVAELLCRLLFCCFADSVGVLTKRGLYPIVLNYTEASGLGFGSFLDNLFAAIKSRSREGLPSYFADIQYIDVRLFKDVLPPLRFTKVARNYVLELLGLDWTEVNPEILGALVQATVRPDVRNFGANYTSTSNVQKVIGPLFMDELYRTFEDVKGDKPECEALLRRIQKINIFDPSCGAGNFLLATYKELNRLAGKVLDEIETSNTSNTIPRESSLHSLASGFQLLIPPQNFHGIDEDPFCCAIARLGFFITICQDARKSGGYESEFAKAIDVLFDNKIVAGNATRLNWETICSGKNETYLIGNPSYVGARKQNPSQKSDLRHVFADYDKIGNLDYAACWFMLATKYICAHGGRFAFVTTNSLTQGEQVHLLWPKLFEKGVHIRFAHTSFKLKNDARNQTGVTVVIIGVALNPSLQPCELYTTTKILEPKNISPYLTAGETIVYPKNGAPLSSLPTMLKGNMPLYWSSYFLSREEKIELVQREPRAEKFLRKVVGAKEFIRGIERWCFWIKDEDLSEAMEIPEIAERIELVRQKRLASSDASARKHAATPHKFRESREALKNTLVVPSVSSENREFIPVGYARSDTVLTNLVFVIHDCEPWVFGVISSRMHNLWIRTVCGALETRIRYSSDLGYNTFPFPLISEQKRETIASRAHDVIAAREKFPDMTYTQWYEPGRMPQELSYAHHLLDLVVDSCYRNDQFVSDRERLDTLFDLYLELNGQ